MSPPNCCETLNCARQNSATCLTAGNTIGSGWNRPRPSPHLRPHTRPPHLLSRWPRPACMLATMGATCTNAPRLSCCCAARWARWERLEATVAWRGPEVAAAVAEVLPNRIGLKSSTTRPRRRHTVMCAARCCGASSARATVVRWACWISCYGTQREL